MINSPNVMNSIWERYSTPIGGDREKVIGKSLSSAGNLQGCWISINIEDERVASSVLKMRQFLGKLFGILPISDNCLVIRNSIFLKNLEAKENLSKEILTSLVRSQLLFVIIFGVSSPREVVVKWEDIYADRETDLARNLKIGEVAILRTRLRSQDTFELCSVKLTSTA